jgi:hypothetical protein
VASTPDHPHAHHEYNVFSDSQKTPKGRGELPNIKFTNSEVQSFRHSFLTEQQFKISGLELHHGELRFLSGGLSQKNKKGKNNFGETGKADFPPLFNETKTGFQPSSMASFEDSNFSGKTKQELQERTPVFERENSTFENESISSKKTVKEEALNLRTFDLRFYKQSFLMKKDAKEYTKNSFGQRKIGEFIRFGEEMEQNLSVDKTLQIIRRSRSFSSSFKTQEEEKRKSNEEGFYSYTFRRVHPYLISNQSP